MQENTEKRPVKVLFVCSANMDRSPTAENLFNKICGFQAKSAGQQPMQESKSPKI